MEGGKIIGHGSYGCVFNPPLICEKKIIKKNTVSKYLFSENKITHKEINIGKKLIKIDPKNNYFIGINETCLIKKNYENYENISSCQKKDKDYPLITRKDFLFKKSPDILIMKKGGITLLDFLENYDISLYNLLNLIKHLLKGIQLLSRNNICHLDIKNNNILVEPDKFLAILIDFGFTASNKKELKHFANYFELDEPIPVLDNGEISYFYRNAPEIYLITQHNRNFNKWFDNISTTKLFEKIMIYDLGITFFPWQEKSIILENLLNNMTKIQPEERFNISEAINYIDKYKAQLGHPTKRQGNGSALSSRFKKNVSVANPSLQNIWNTTYKITGSSGKPFINKSEMVKNLNSIFKNLSKKSLNKSIISKNILRSSFYKYRKNIDDFDKYYYDIFEQDYYNPYKIKKNIDLLINELNKHEGLNEKKIILDQLFEYILANKQFLVNRPTYRKKINHLLNKYWFDLDSIKYAYELSTTRRQIRS